MRFYHTTADPGPGRGVVCTGWYNAGESLDMAALEGAILPEKAMLASRSVLTVIAALAGVQQALCQTQPVSLWTLNTSVLGLYVEGEEWTFRYEEPRRGLHRVGVRAGTTLVKGTRSGDLFAGVAYVFTKDCGAYPFQVKGTLTADQSHLVLRGASPTSFDGNCVAVSPKVVQFEIAYLRSTAPPPLAAAPPVQASSPAKEPDAPEPATVKTGGEAAPEPAVVAKPGSAETKISPEVDRAAEVKTISGEAPSFSLPTPKEPVRLAEITGEILAGKKEPAHTPGATVPKPQPPPASDSAPFPYIAMSINALIAIGLAAVLLLAIGRVSVRSQYWLRIVPFGSRRASSTQIEADQANASQTSRRTALPLRRAAGAVRSSLRHVAEKPQPTSASEASGAAAAVAALERAYSHLEAIRRAPTPGPEDHGGRQEHLAALDLAFQELDAAERHDPNAVLARQIEGGERTFNVDTLKAEGYLLRGLTLQTTDLGSAIPALRQATIHNPKCPVSFYVLGLTHAALVNHAEAVRWLERAVTLDPANPAYLRELAKLRKTA